jgi:F420-non-reducing hydrogenase iron-sulfur subunit
MSGTMRAQYPESIRPVRVICTARVSADMILRSLNKGADGVLIGG